MLSLTVEEDCFVFMRNSGEDVLCTTYGVDGFEGEDIFGLGGIEETAEA